GSRGGLSRCRERDTYTLKSSHRNREKIRLRRAPPMICRIVSRLVRGDRTKVGGAIGILRWGAHAKWSAILDLREACKQMSCLSSPRVRNHRNHRARAP